nr:hypothetical protein [bacterium]
MVDQDTDEMLDKIRKSFNDVDNQIINGAKNMRAMQSQISKTNNILKSDGWQIFSRFISGSGLWQIQNKVRASIMLVEGMMSAEERRRKKQAEELKTLAEIAKSSEIVRQKNNQITMAIRGTVAEREAVSDQLKKESEIYAGLLFKYGDATVALKAMQDQLSYQVKNSDKLEKAANKRAEAEKFGLIRGSLTMKLVRKLTNEYENLGKSSVKSIPVDKFKEGEKHLANLKRIQEKLGFESMEGLVIDSKGGKVGRNAVPKIIGGSNKLTNREAINSKTIALIQEYMDYQQEHGDEIAAHHEQVRKSQRIRNKLFRTLKTPFVNIGKFVKGIFSSIGRLLIMFLKLSAVFLLVILGLALLASLLKETKVQLIEGFEAMKQTFSFGLGIIGSGLGNLITSVTALWEALQSGKIVEALQAGGGILYSVVEILSGIIVATIGALLVGIGTYLMGVWKMAGANLTNTREKFVAGFINVIRVVAGIVAGIAFVAALIFGMPAIIVAGIAGALFLAATYALKHITPITNFLSSIYDFFLGIAEFFSQSKLASAIADAVREAVPDPKGTAKAIGGRIKGIVGLAEGGRISHGGLAVVGERGPELVTLPRGAQVHSNSQSRAMASTVTNNITVQVTGRVGANDAEIRDIAQKVSREINSRMNRTSTTAVNF